MASTGTVAREDTVSPEIEALFREQKTASRRVRRTTARERIAKLQRIKGAVESNLPAIQEALAADFGKPPEESLLTEVYPLRGEIDHISSHLREWMAPRVLPASAAFTGAACELRYQPKGVVLIISPWNYPFQLVLGPLVSALAAGNCAVIKPSEFTPLPRRWPPGCRRTSSLAPKWRWCPARKRSPRSCCDSPSTTSFSPAARPWAAR